MTALTALLVLASAGPGLLADHTFTIPPGEWRFVEVSAPDGPSLLQADFVAIEGGSDLRVVLIPARDLDRYRRTREVRAVDDTGWGRSARLVHHFDGAGAWGVILEHQPNAREPASVRLRVRLDPAANPRLMPTGRKVAAILSGVAFLLFVAIWAGRRLS